MKARPTNKPFVIASTREEVDNAPHRIDYNKAKLVFALGEDDKAEFRVRGIEPMVAIGALLVAAADIAGHVGIDDDEFRGLVGWMLDGGEPDEGSTRGSTRGSI